MTRRFGPWLALAMLCVGVTVLAWRTPSIGTPLLAVPEVSVEKARTINAAMRREHIDALFGCPGQDGIGGKGSRKFVAWYGADVTVGVVFDDGFADKWTAMPTNGDKSERAYLTQTWLVTVLRWLRAVT